MFFFFFSFDHLIDVSWCDVSCMDTPYNDKWILQVCTPQVIISIKKTPEFVFCTDTRHPKKKSETCKTAKPKRGRVSGLIEINQAAISVAVSTKQQKQKISHILPSSASFCHFHTFFFLFFGMSFPSRLGLHIVGFHGIII